MVVLAIDVRKPLAWCALLLGTVGVPASNAVAKPATLALIERRVVSRYSINIEGRNVRYTATAGTLLQRDNEHHPIASVFYIAYVAQGMGPNARRPVTFAYNGGPGVSSTSLNLGAFGPKVVAGLSIDHRRVPQRLIDNPNTLLAKTDLVFIDAVGTGFSRIAGNASEKSFYGVDEDANTFTQFIRRYTLLNGRSKSPKYLLGLSYGTTRSAVVANDLEGDGIKLSGIVLMSTALNFPAITGGAGQDLQYSLYLPTEAMIAAYYGEVSVAAQSRDRWLSDVRAFAIGPYAEALERGDALPAAERVRTARQLHAFVGLPVSELLQANLRVSPDRFATALLAGRHRRIGRYDARVSVANTAATSAAAGGDPSTTAESAAFAAAIASFLHGTLRYPQDGEYVLTSIDVNRQWNWGEAGPSGTNVTDDLAEAMMADPHLRILSLNGYYDLATPFFGTEYQLAHLGITPTLRRRIALRYYHSGHMIFIDPQAHAEMKHDLDNFYDAGRRYRT